MHYPALPTAFAPALLRRLAEPVEAAWHRWQQRRRARWLMNALHDLPLSTLEDISAPCWIVREAKAAEARRSLELERLRHSWGIGMPW